MTRRRKLLLSIALILPLLLLPFFMESVWDGQFTLTLVISPDSQLGKQQILVATCPSKTEADVAVSFPFHHELTFRPATPLGENRYQVRVNCGGRTNQFGFESTYSQHNGLIVQYTSADGEIRYASFTIPPGRGARTLLISLPLYPSLLPGEGH